MRESTLLFAAIIGDLQMGAVGTRMGKHWIIENCTITNGKTVRR